MKSYTCVDFARKQKPYVMYGNPHVVDMRIINIYVVHVGGTGGLTGSIPELR